MVKFYEGNYLFKFTWDQVAQGFWLRYPNPHSQHVLTEDVISREVRDKKLFSRRLFTKTNRLPRWGEMFVSNRTVSIVEDSVVDPVNRTLTTHTKNVGYTKVMGVEERCVYHVCAENPRWTKVERKAWITSSMFGVARAVEAFGFERFRVNSHRAMQGFQYILEMLFSPDSPDRISGKLLDKAKLKEKVKEARELAKSRTTRLEL